MGLIKKDVYTDRQSLLARWFKALGHPARIAIVEQLLRSQCCICKDFTSEIDLAQPTISRHLQELKSAGIICGSIEGVSVSYCINPLQRNKLKQLLATVTGDI